MSDPNEQLAGLIDRSGFAAVLFDLDGVLTETATVHAAAWKEMFDAFLRSWADAHSVEFVAFDVATDYPRYVDGKPRYEGVRSFLASRGIELPEGASDDPADAETVCGLGNRKNDLVQTILETKGVTPYPGSVRLLRHVRDDLGLKTAVVSSSKNCKAVIEAAGIADCFDERVDGWDVEEGGIPGKPAPDTFLEAARRLGVDPTKGVVFEDALAGVQAGHAGGFGLVIGVDRAHQADALREHGADVVVDDLAELLPS
ncbi:MAG TPA: beta-phosphoglucomutase family hydrolase [Acidimicrobiales bacterium]